MTENQTDQSTAGERLEYRRPEITDLGSVGEVTAASTGNPGTVDGQPYSGPAHS